VSGESAEAAELAIYEYLGMDRDEPESWYGAKLGHSIWVPLLRHPALWANRRSARMVKAFAQLWGREDLWVTVDQGGLNPPEREGWRFPGPHLHWDTTLAAPHHFGVQGILYLADTAAEQGAFCCVPGFHRRLAEWLESLPVGADARDIALRTLTPTPIAAGRGDMILWHQSLPHGSSPNRGTRPRVAQYISMRPTRWQYNAEWR
jgi:ectoine hydroxylase-related dioxygenase (phytanoyl-CoA dioxygenase family)